MSHLFALLACATPTGPGCDDSYEWDNPACEAAVPCADMVYVMTSISSARCRSDQAADVSWEPASAARVDDESRAAGVVVCRCRRAP